MSNLISFYKIKCKNENIKECYIGSTKDMKNRIKNHKYNNETKKVKVYDFINSNGGWKNWLFEVLITIELDDDGIDRKVIEQQYIDSEGDNLNMIRAYSDSKQYYIQKKEYDKQYCIDNAEKRREYRIENAEKIKEYTKQYRIENAEKLTEYHKQWRIENAEYYKEYNKQYKNRNAEYYKEYNKLYRLKNKK